MDLGYSCSCTPAPRLGSQGHSEGRGPTPGLRGLCHTLLTPQGENRLRCSEVIVTVVGAGGWTRCPQGPFQAYVVMTFALHRDAGATMPWAA